MKKLHVLTLVAAAALLAACGGGDPDRGALRATPTAVATLPAAALTAGATQSGLIGLSGAAKCDVRVVPLDYVTVGVRGEGTNSTGVMLVPSGSAAGCSGPFPLLAYSRGTEVSKPRTLANPADAETGLLATMYAAQGYAVVATDYLGFAGSDYSFHPYLHADSQATTIVDSIRAARRAASTLGVNLSGKVMVSGYSQGGHASMAAHRAIERDHASEINLVGGAHLAGPYNLSGSFKLPDAIAGYQFFVPFLVTAWQKIYGNIYGSVGQAFKAPYATNIENLLPSPTLNYTTLVTTGALPGANGETPNQARDALFQSAFITDVRTNDSNALFLAAKRNDLLGWTPRAATMLCSGSGDPTVPFAVHQAVMKADFDARNVRTAAGPVASVDVDPQIRAAFGAPPTDPAGFAQYYSRYHGTFAPPVCAASARNFFDTVK
ncbi:MAG: lipase family protein [Burkholderiaceae bacterium]